ncbi:RING finger protein 212B-like [Gouania willdenowi]|uniref:RING finger protein 212B-like n=1 Tax=Gouania willdenowi TaxID=441366 RepID=UPI001055995A|nr:RING finger protein 212B [Gouania willdenowi]
MEWFHCNQCFTKKGTKFAVSSCGHICCSECIKSRQCGVCGTCCSYLPITDEMKPQEKVFFKDPVKLFQSQMKHVCQIATFQQTQMELIIKHFKHRSDELEKHLNEVSRENSDLKKQLSEMKRERVDLKKQFSELRKETDELKKPLSQRRVSPAGQFRTDSTQRMSLPVAVTSPVTPRSRPMSNVGSTESHRWTRDRGLSLSLNTPGSSASISSHSSLNEHRTPSFFTTPRRTDTPNIFQLQFMSGISVQSPRL